MGRFAKARLTAEERAARKLRRHDNLRQIKSRYVHKDFYHGPFAHPGDGLLADLLEITQRDETMLVCSNQRHLRRLQTIKQRMIWHTEDPVDSDDVLLGKVPREPDASGQLQRLNFSRPLSSAFVCERLQKQEDLGSYLIALREAVAVDAPVALVVPLVHHELVDDHVNLFTAGTLIYNMVRAGWNCHDARVEIAGKRFIEVLVRRRDVPEPWPRRVDELCVYTPFKNVFQYCSSEFPEIYR